MTSRGGSRPAIADPCRGTLAGSGIAQRKHARITPFFFPQESPRCRSRFSRPRPHDHEVEHVAHHGGDNFTAVGPCSPAIISTVGAIFGYMGGHSVERRPALQNEAAIQKTSASNQLELLPGQQTEPRRSSIPPDQRRNVAEIQSGKSQNRRPKSSKPPPGGRQESEPRCVHERWALATAAAADHIIALSAITLLTQARWLLVGVYGTTGITASSSAPWAICIAEHPASRAGAMKQTVNCRLGVRDLARSRARPRTRLAESSAPDARRLYQARRRVCSFGREALAGMPASAHQGSGFPTTLAHNGEAAVDATLAEAIRRRPPVRPANAPVGRLNFADPATVSCGKSASPFFELDETGAVRLPCPSTVSHRARHQRGARGRCASNCHQHHGGKGGQYAVSQAEAHRPGRPSGKPTARNVRDTGHQQRHQAGKNQAEQHRGESLGNHHQYLQVNCALRARGMNAPADGRTVIVRCPGALRKAAR